MNNGTERLILTKIAIDCLLQIESMESINKLETAFQKLCWCVIIDTSPDRKVIRD